MSTPAPVDYEALARQAGAIQSKAPGQKIDYDSLAQQAGAIQSAQAPAIKPPARPPKPDDTGVFSALKRVGTAIFNAPGDILMSTQPRTPQEAAAYDTSNPVATAASAAKLGFQHLISDPMQAEAETSRRMTGIAQRTGNEDAQHLANMHAIASGVPGLGPMAAPIVQRYLQGDKSGAVTELGANIAAPEALNKALNVPLPGNPLKGTPKQALSRTINATAGGGVPFRESIEIAKPDLDAAAAQQPVKTIQDVRRVANLANENFNKEFDTALAPIAKQQTVPIAVSDAIKSEITPGMMKTAEGRATVAVLKKRALEFETQPWTWDELNQERMRMFAKTAPFNNATTEAQAVMSKAGRANLIADRAILQATRDAVYDALDQYHNKNLAPGATPYDFSALKRRQAALLDIKFQLDNEIPKVENAADVLKGSGFLERGHVSTYGTPGGRIGASIHSLQNLFTDPESRANLAAQRAFPEPPPAAPALSLDRRFPTPQAVMLGMKAGDLSTDEGARLLQKMRAGQVKRLRPNGSE